MKKWKQCYKDHNNILRSTVVDTKKPYMCQIYDYQILVPLVLEKKKLYHKNIFYVLSHSRILTKNKKIQPSFLKFLLCNKKRGQNYITCNGMHQ